MKLFLLILIAWLVIIVIRQNLNKSKASRESKKPKPDLPASTIKCEHCGTYVPQREAVKVQDHYYCSEEHARLGSDKHPD